MKQNKNIAILGAGESGVGAAVLAKKQGYEVFVSDFGKIKQGYKNILEQEQIEWEEGTHTLDRILKANEIVKSPGIADKVEVIKKAVEKSIPVISEIEFGSRYTKAKLICITGSNGKTTTTMLTHHILEKAGLNVGLAGNIGDSFAMQVATENYDYYVIELSSFQLDGVQKFKADVAILLNITPDHLDRYEYKFENYVKSKFKITNNQTEEDYFIYCKDDEAISSALSNKNLQSKQFPFSIKEELKTGAYLNKNEEIVFTNTNHPQTMSIHDLALNGKHNIYNSMAAGIAAKVLDLRKEIVRESLTDFQNVEHRLEQICYVNGIEFINDSKATNVNAVWYALESINKPIVWIAGGVDKGNDYEELIPLVKDKVKALVCLGVDNTKLVEAFGDVVDVYETTSAKDAVKLSYKLATKGEMVLLSPACASFDLFDNYEERGLAFRKAVREL
ncbi:MAG: UDP-N-acetylmuramoyl-L-alanine--D-glutamate ligase [Flavobacteriales bacterium]